MRRTLPSLFGCLCECLNICARACLSEHGAAPPKHTTKESKPGLNGPLALSEVNMSEPESGKSLSDYMSVGKQKVPPGPPWAPSREGRQSKTNVS